MSTIPVMPAMSFIVSRHRPGARSSALALSLLLACSRRDATPRDTIAAAPVVAEQAAVRDSLTARTPPVVGRNLRALRWIEGSWRGTGETQAPFYERYRLVDDSTLVTEGFTDSTLATVTETTRFALRGGALTSIPGATGEPAAGVARWYASSLTGDSVRFEPLSAVRNSFVWRRGASANDWVAVLSWPASAARPARHVTYTMRRWR